MWHIDEETIFEGPIGFVWMLCAHILDVQMLCACSYRLEGFRAQMLSACEYFWADAVCLPMTIFGADAVCLPDVLYWVDA